MCYRQSNQPYNTEKLGKLTKHHLQPRSRGGACKESNISYVPSRLHEVWHFMFSNYSPTKIAHIINEHWIPKDVTMVALSDEELELVKDVLSKHHLRKF